MSIPLEILNKQIAAEVDRTRSWAVYKHPVPGPTIPGYTIPLPRSARPLFRAIQRGQEYLWALVDSQDLSKIDYEVCKTFIYSIDNIVENIQTSSWPVHEEEFQIADTFTAPDIEDYGRIRCAIIRDPYNFTLVFAGEPPALPSLQGFRLAGTGHPIPASEVGSLEFVCPVTNSDMSLVLHLFRVVPVAPALTP